MGREKWLVGGLAAALALATLALLTVSVVAVTIMLDDEGDGEPAAAHRFHEGPVQAIVDLTDTGKEKWGSTLGPSCNLDKVYVLALGQDAGGVDVVSFPGDCSVNRFRVSEADGGVRPEDPLAIQ